MDIYSSAWRKGLKSTYYLHMKPRHSAEQSTVAVNKSAKLGKMGFASVFKEKTEPQEVATPVMETKIPAPEPEPAIPAVEITREETVEDVVKPVVIPVDQPSGQIFAKVQTQFPASTQGFSTVIPTSTPTPAEVKPLPVENIQKSMPASAQMNVASEMPTQENVQTKMIGGKVYKVHMPSDPQENFTCDGCQ
jgi:ribonucleoside-diphosphate reductase alpha chain